MPIEADSEQKKTEPTTAPALGQRAFGGAIWMLGQTVGSKIGSVTAQLVLAALLTQSDFGCLAEVLFIVTLLGFGTQSGVSQILVRRHRNFEKWAEIAFWFNLAIGLIGTLLVVAIAPFANFFFKDAHGLTTLLLVAAIGLPFDAMTAVAQAKLNVDLRFRTIALIGTSNVVGTAVLSVAFAATKFIWPHSVVSGAMALVLPRPLVSIAVLVASFWLSGMRLKMRPMFRRWPFIVRDSRYFFFTNFFNTFLNQGDYLLTGLFFSTERLGAYFFAFNLSTQTVQMVSFNLATVLLSSFSKLDREPLRQKDAYLRTCTMITLIGGIACVLQAILGGPFLHLVYGSKWDEAIPLFEILTVGMFFLLPRVAAPCLLMAQGRYRRYMWWTFILAVMFMVSVLIGILTGTTKGIALADTIFFALVGPSSVLVPFDSTFERYKEVLRRVYQFPILAVLAAALAALGIFAATSRLPELARAVLMAIGAGATYVGCAIVWQREEMQDLIARIRPYTAKFFPVGRT